MLKLIKVVTEVPRAFAGIPRLTAEVPRTFTGIPRPSAEVPRTLIDIPKMPTALSFISVNHNG